MVLTQIGRIGKEPSFFEPYERLWNLISTYIPYIPLVDELNPKPANQVWGAILEVGADGNKVNNSSGQRCTTDSKAIEVQRVYFHVLDVRTIYDEGHSGCFKIHRDYFYQLDTQQAQAFSTRQLAKATDPENPRKILKTLDTTSGTNDAEMK